MFITKLNNNLFSVCRATDKGYVMVINKAHAYFIKIRLVLCKQIGNSYFIYFCLKHELANIVRCVNNHFERHERLVHQNFDYVREVVKQNNTYFKQTSFPKCESCQSFSSS